jgi:hypothetical protein
MCVGASLLNFRLCRFLFFCPVSGAGRQHGNGKYSQDDDLLHNNFLLIDDVILTDPEVMKIILIRNILFSAFFLEHPKYQGAHKSKIQRTAKRVGCNGTGACYTSHIIPVQKSGNCTCQAANDIEFICDDPMLHVSGF